MCLDLLLGSIIKIKQATIPLGKSSAKSFNEAELGFSKPDEKVGAAQLDAGHSTDGTLPFQPKLNKLKETCSLTFRCDTMQRFSLQST